MKNQIIHPEEPQELSTWASKWGVSEKQLRLAIIDTGHVDAQTLKVHLIEGGQMFSLKRFLRHLFNL